MTLKEYVKKYGHEVLRELSEAKSVEELKQLFANRCIEVNDDEIQNLYSMISNTKTAELTDDELDEVTGGETLVPGWAYFYYCEYWEWSGSGSANSGRCQDCSNFTPIDAGFGCCSKY